MANRYLRLQAKCPRCGNKVDLTHVTVDLEKQDFIIFALCPFCNKSGVIRLDIRDYIEFERPEDTIGLS